MSSSPVTPDNGNPFDRPLNSELQESQQRKAATPPLDTGFVNPFDEPLASEKAEQQHREAMPNVYEKATAAGPYAEPGAAERAMGEQFGDNKAQAMQALKSTGQAALETAGGIAGASVAGPVLAAIASHFGDLDKIIGMAKKYGWGVDIGYREARELYKDFIKEDKNK